MGKLSGAKWHCFEDRWYCSEEAVLVWEIDHRPCVVAGLCRSWRLGRSLQLYQHGFRCWGGDNTEAVGTNRETRWLFCLLSLSGILGFGVGFCGNEEDGWHSYPGGGEGDSLGSMLSSRWLRCVRPHGIRWMSSEVGTEGRREFVVRRDWSIDEVRAVYSQPLLELIYQGATAHRENFKADEVQQCTLLSVKTGGCPEDCKYCSQSSKYETAVKAEPLMQVEDVLQSARRARDAGSTRFCMGAAWRGVSQVGPRQFQRVLDMVKGVRSLGLEVCATLGMVDADQARRLKEAGLTAYNHNLDTSKEFYPKVITSRKYEDRLRTLQHVRDAGISVCCGGIIGLGETHEDRISLIHTLATLPEHPESVPVNALVANEGTPLEDQTPLPVWDLCRMIATSRLVMPKSMVRLSAGRVSLSQAEQAMCFLAGANSIFTGDKLLTTPNPAFNTDKMMFDTLGLRGKAPYFPSEDVSPSPKEVSL